MGVPEINLTEKTRCLISKVASVMCLVTIPFNLFMLTIAVYIELAVQDKVSLIEGSRDALPAYMIILGLVGLIVNILASRVCWVVHDMARRDVWKKFLIPVFFLSFILFVCIFVASMLCFANVASLRKLFSKGIYVSMKKYATDMPKKSIIDKLQIQYECCGSEGYTDWFHVKFVSKKYITDEYMTKDEQHTYKKFTDHVPFSCCNYRARRPCIDTRVQAKHYKYEYTKDITLYTQGCSDALMTSYNHMLKTAGAVVVILAFLELMIGLETRLLQTGLANLIDDEDSKGFLIPFGGGKAQGKVEDDDKQKLLPDGPPPAPMTKLASLQNLPPVGSIDNISVTESFDDEEELPPPDVEEEFPPPPSDLEDLPPPRQSVKYVNEMDIDE
ncbi:peripherin-2-like [Saccostrea echinata]|uniref:peripherin-2-like n=1 Tax=Saccostrea echinata TaxID=191078 RepID=UPI002A8126A4|nr:peripherin-2-like [Saccostrea echinata]